MKRKRLRNPRGQYTQDLRMARWFIMTAGIGFTMLLTFLGINTIYHELENVWDKFATVIIVNNTQAEEVKKPETIREKISFYSKMYGVSQYQVYRTIQCESGFRNIQSGIIKNGVREDSWGLAQINLHYHPSVSRLQALDQDFAIEWMAKHFNTVTWHGYNRVTDRCN